MLPVKKPENHKISQSYLYQISRLPFKEKLSILWLLSVVIRKLTLKHYFLLIFVPEDC